MFYLCHSRGSECPSRLSCSRMWWVPFPMLDVKVAPHWQRCLNSLPTSHGPTWDKKRAQVSCTLILGWLQKVECVIRRHRWCTMRCKSMSWLSRRYASWYEMLIVIAVVWRCLESSPTILAQRPKGARGVYSIFSSVCSERFKTQWLSFAHMLDVFVCLTVVDARHSNKRWRWLRLFIIAADIYVRQTHLRIAI